MITKIKITGVILLFIFYITPSFISSVKAEALPDLVISSIQISPSQPFQNQSFIITTTIANLGTAAATQGFVLNMTIYKNVISPKNLINFVSWGFFPPFNTNTVRSSQYIRQRFLRTPSCNHASIRQE